MLKISFFGWFGIFLGALNQQVYTYMSEIQSGFSPATIYEKTCGFKEVLNTQQFFTI
jgi:hypothetical protein